MNITILKSKEYSINESSFLYPIRENIKEIKNLDVCFNWSSNLDKLKEGNLLLISSHAFRKSWLKYGVEFTLEKIKNISNTFDRTYWLDMNDSTGTTQFDVLPYVDKYLKLQILKDKKKYLNSYLTGRIHTDFYIKYFDIKDEINIEEHLSRKPSINDLKKISCSWNYGCKYFGNLSKYNDLFCKYFNSHLNFKNEWVRPSINRTKKISARFSTSYSRESISLSRKRFSEHFNTGDSVRSINYRKYILELSNSFATLSPFGFGEICYRDFEAAINGSLIIKQNMDHLETWPNIWQNDMYLSIDWDFSNVNSIKVFMESNKKHCVDMARYASEYYRSIFTKNLFIKRFKSVILDN